MLDGLTIAFDLDGTLVDTAPDLMGSVDLLLIEKGLAPVPHDLLRPLISHGSRVMLRRALTHLDHTIDQATFDAWWQRYLQLYVSNIAARSRPFDGLVPLLDRLAGRGATLVVCTNKNEAMSRALLTALGLIDRFAAIAGRDTFEHCKPNPGHLTGAVRLGGGDPARAVMVGDSDVDIATARNAGLPVIAVTFGYVENPVASYGPDAVIDHYDHFEAALARLPLLRA
jgi:phosphoglycolate phosphatase